MPSESSLKNAVDVFCRNPYWRDEYVNAPSEICKRYIALTFYESLHDEGTASGRQELEEKLGIEDWKHLLKFAGNNPWRTKCRKKIQEQERIDGIHEKG